MTEGVGIPQKFVADYVWVGGNSEFRSKTRVITVKPNQKSVTLKDIPDWNYDGSSTNQSNREESEVILVPRAMYRNPFTMGNDVLIMCDTYTPDMTPHVTNTRASAQKIFNQHTEMRPWYGLEQEYFIIDPNTNLPVGYEDGKTQGQGTHYCGAGAENVFGRSVADQHMALCIRAGITISGINAEVAPGQWEFQVGPCEGIQAGDDMMMARYLLIRVAETKNLKVTFEPKPLKGNWNGSGCHTNFSTVMMREGSHGKTGLDYINQAIKCLETDHTEMISKYGSGNQERMTGLHETADYNVFSHGVANRGVSVRIGNETYRNKKGYFEDRRPSSNCDPYVVTSLIMKSITA
jgi:glutamine synthetase